MYISFNIVGLKLTTMSKIINNYCTYVRQFSVPQIMKVIPVILKFTVFATNAKPTTDWCLNL